MFKRFIKRLFRAWFQEVWQAGYDTGKQAFPGYEYVTYRGGVVDGRVTQACKGSREIRMPVLMAPHAIENDGLCSSSSMRLREARYVRTNNMAEVTIKAPVFEIQPE